jgi:hypothetical protein
MYGKSYFFVAVGTVLVPFLQPLEANKGKVSTCHREEILIKKGKEGNHYCLC